MAAPDHCGKDQLLESLIEWGITTDTVEHPEVFTVEQALPYVKDLDGTFAKNIFLRDKKKRLYLFCAPHDTEVKLNDLAKILKVSGGLRFADESVLTEKLGLRQGAVTVFGLLNDKTNDVTLVLDRKLLTLCSKIYWHPMVNTASTGITPEGLTLFLQKTGHEPHIIDIPDT
ncbi:hypothetical protein ScPMuIL_013919 [Solemya velum]